MVPSLLGALSLTLAQVFRRSMGLAGALLVTCSLLFAVGARSLLTWGDRGVHTGIADPVPTVFTYTVVVLAYGGWLIVRPGAARLPFPHLIFLISLAVITAVAFSGNPVVVSGALHIGTAVVAWSLGDYVGRSLAGASTSSLRYVAYGLSFVVAIEVSAAIIQLLGVTVTLGGFELIGSPPHGRVTGTFGHPTAVGKFLFLLLLVLLPMSRSVDQRTAFAVWATILAAAAVIGMSQSRANLIAIVAALIIWVVFTTNTLSVAGRVVWVALVALVFLPFVNPVLDRFFADPDGGDRPELLVAGLAQIRESPLLGTGANNYVPVVGTWDPTTATGFPVHNSFLLLVAELGIPLAVLLLCPALMSWWIALSLWVRGARNIPYASAIVATLPGLMLILNTGWGMVNRELLVAWFFFAAVAAAGARMEKPKAFLACTPHGSEKKRARRGQRSRQSRRTPAVPSNARS